METTIYHNPRCSKSRETLALLIAHGISPRVVDYQKIALDRATLKSILTALGTPAHAIVRKSEPVFLAEVLDQATEEGLLDALVRFPILLERPIVVAGTRAAIGRPPANVLALFER